MVKKSCYVDFGHGGKDPGAMGNGLKEKDVTLSVGKKVVNILKRHNVRVVTSRMSDTTVSLKGRTDKANRSNVDCFVSIHTNAHTSNAKGLETFSFPGSTNGAKLRKCLHDEVIKARLYNSNRGLKTANFHVLRETKAPASLIEMAFITNKDDAKLLKNKQSQFAEAIAKGILKYLGIKYIPKKTTPPTNVLYKVQAGAFSNKSNAERLQKELKKKGYNTIIVKEGK